MKMRCEVVQDLLPLYVEQMVQDVTKQEIEEHLQDCTGCKARYEELNMGEQKIQYDIAPAQSYKKFVRKKKIGLGLKVAAITAVAIMILVVIRLAAVGGIMAFFTWDILNSKVEVSREISDYNKLIGSEADELYANKWGMDESIFPSGITEEMSVNDFKMVYYNPWDAQYLSYLVVDYTKQGQDSAKKNEAYLQEVERLKKYPSTEYVGYYGVIGFEEYELLAMYADSYNGFVYALTDGSNRIIYVELIFCNYFFDLDYKQYIPEQYLPEGFDATEDNEYRAEKMSAYSFWE